MSVRLKLCAVLLLGCLPLLLNGCLVRRTVKEDGVVVARGYAITGPLLIE